MMSISHQLSPNEILVPEKCVKLRQARIILVSCLASRCWVAGFGPFDRRVSRRTCSHSTYALAPARGGDGQAPPVSSRRTGPLSNFEIPS